MFTLEIHEKKSMPKLSWLACFEDNLEKMEIYCGPMVEISKDWLFEGCWDGKFKDGDFDRVEIVMGTGIRVRDSKVHFVTPSHVYDKLFRVKYKSRWYVSNSLPIILAKTGLSLDININYWPIMSYVMKGIEKPSFAIPTSQGVSIECVYYENMTWNGLEFIEFRKPLQTPRFYCFAEYKNFLFNKMKSLSTNLNAESRKYKPEIISTISSGYDSPVTSILAKEIGCKQAVTFVKRRFLQRNNDSGVKIANMLNIPVKCVRRCWANIKDMELFWANCGSIWDSNISLIDFSESMPVCLVTGLHGDTWDMHYVEQNLADIHKSDRNGLGLTEYRLAKGIIHIPVIFMGISQVNDIQKISKSDEMKPWLLTGKYDKPIPRRILEEAGVPRKMFGIGKRATVMQDIVLPNTTELLKDLREFQKKNKLQVSNRCNGYIAYLLLVYEILRYKFTKRKLDKSWTKFLPTFSEYFVWSNDLLKRRYLRVFD